MENKKITLQTKLRECKHRTEFNTPHPPSCICHKSNPKPKPNQWPLPKKSIPITTTLKTNPFHSNSSLTTSATSVTIPNSHSQTKTSSITVKNTSEASLVQNIKD